MKKVMGLAITALAIIGLNTSYAGEISGGLFRIGGYFGYNPQAALNTAIKAGGYPELSGLSYGMTIGGGGFGGNFYFGGWGTVINSSEVLKSAASERTMTYGGGFGGFEFGYAVVYSGGFILMPTVSFLWGGYGMSFQTNLTFAQYLNNPVEYSPEIGSSIFSISAGITTGMMFMDKVGFLARINYIYTPFLTWDGAVLSATPEYNQHSLFVTLEMAFGTLIPGKDISHEIDADELPSGLPEDDTYVQ
ncbi:MAG: hypothetical protein HPY53_08130 [Brevinematales bacterium]|nr:hypothetical protein [Brevinematales bacterium]